MKGQVRTLFFIFLFLFSTVCQDQVYYTPRVATVPKFYDATEGAMYKHVYSTPLWISTATTTTFVTVNGTIPEGVFDSTQNIVYATSLIRFALTSVPAEVSGYVQNITINAARTQFTLYFRTSRPQVISNTGYDSIGFNVIFIGSNFNKQSSGLTSGFARNSKLVPVTTTGAAFDSAQFDFSGNNGQSSPFGFIPDGTTNGCGVSDFGTNAKIQIIGCARPILFTAITGFNFQSATAATLIMSSILRDLAANAAAITAAYSIPVPSVTPSSPTYLYMANSTDGIYGPLITFKKNVASSLSRIQFSLVFIGLRTFTTLPLYPSTSPDSFLVAAGFTAANIDASTVPPTILNDAIVGTINLDSDSYTVTTPGNRMGSAFCGFIQSSGVSQAGKFYIDMSSNNQIRANIDTPDALTLGVNANAEGFKVGCIFITKKTVCSNDQKQIFSSTFTSSATPNTVTVTDNTLGLNSNTAGTGTAFSPAKSLYQFTIAGYSSSTTSTQTSIIKNFPIPNDRTEIKLYLATQASGSPAGAAADTLIFTYTIAGKTYPNISLNLATHQFIYITETLHVTLGTTTVPVNFTLYTTAGATLTPFIVKFGLFYFNNVVSSTLDCIGSCPEVANQTTGVSGTTTPPQCIYCKASDNKVYDNDTGKCICKTNYYEDTNKICQPCTDPLCSSCDPTTPATCLTCVSNSTLVTVSTPACTCLDGFYRNGSTCLPCPIGCATCTSPTACTSCKTSTNSLGVTTRQSATLNCKCLDGYFEVSTTAVCSTCSPLCATCETSATNCTSCASGKNFVLTQNSCTCAAGYYLLNNNCQACSPICKTCEVSSIYCITCPDLRVLAGTNNPSFKTCNCNLTAGYVQVDNVCVDASCGEVDKNCQTCTLDLTGLRTKSCLSCLDNRVVIAGKCVCKPGFFEGADGKCAACGSGCQQCTSATSCQTCATAASNNGDGTCSCRAGTLLITFGGGLYCQPCSSNCATCTTTSTTCATCKTGFTLQTSTSKCICPAGTFVSPDGNQCIPCLSKCELCTSSVTCDKCAAGYIFDSILKQCNLNCLDGYYNSGVACIPCPSGCASCYTELICSSCNTGFNMYAGSCRATCPDGTYAENGQCLACAQECATCSSLTSCNSCTDQYVLLANKCLTDCVAGTFYADRSCRACDPSCATCTGTSSNCISCPSPRILYNSACYDICPVATVNGVCTNECPSGTILSGKSCVPCNAKCRTCSVTADNCTSCASGLSQNGACVDSCAAGTFASAGFCANCDTSCRTCQGTPFTCTECADGYIRTGQFCIKNCGPGFYIDYSTRNCQPCGANCQQCTSPTRCTLCSDRLLTPVNGICQRLCPAGANLVGGVCVCTLGFLHQSACISSCPQGFYATSDRKCSICSSPCYGCSGSPTSCVSCVSGYTLDPINRVCTQTQSCPYGAFRNSNGQCQKVCSTGYYFGGCIFSCPSGYEPNAYNGCVQSVSPTFCQPPTFQQGSACVQFCQPRFWPNSATRTCDNCPTNCISCLNANFCLACTSGFVLNSAQSGCITSSCQSNQVLYNNKCYATCPVGTYRQGQICVRSCPDKLYFYQDYCYPSCRTVTQFNTPQACVASCPAGATDCTRVQ